MTAEIVAGALASAEAAAGTYGLVIRGGRPARLLRRPTLAAARFTGSTGGGLALAERRSSARSPSPSTASSATSEPVRPSARRRVLPPGRDRHRVHRVADAGRRPVLARPRPAVRLPRPSACWQVSPRRSAPGRGRARIADRKGVVGLPGRGGRGHRAPRRHPTHHQPARAGPWGAQPRAFQVTLKEFATDMANMLPASSLTQPSW